MELAEGAEGAAVAGDQMRLLVQSTTGGSFSLVVGRGVSVEALRRAVARRLKLNKDRICLLHRERQLREGTLEENGLSDGARVILLPSVETGLLTQRPENSVMQALESLNDTQVNDFLSGKSPLNLTMRLGDHMMLIQLQLSTLNPKSSTTTTRTARSTATGVIQSPKKDSSENSTKKSSKKSTAPIAPTAPEASTSEKKCPSVEKTIFRKQDIVTLQNAFEFVRSIAELENVDVDEKVEDSEESPSTEQLPVKSTPLAEDNQSVDKHTELIKSLKNFLDSNPLATVPDVTQAESITDPIAANLTSCLCSSLNPEFPCESECHPSTSTNTSDSSLEDSEMSGEQGSFLAESTLDEYPMENLFNNAVDQGLFENTEDIPIDREISNLATTSHSCDGTAGAITEVTSFQNLAEPNKNKRLHYLLHKTSKYKHPISQNKQKAFMQSVVNKHIKRRLQNRDSAQPQSSNQVNSPRKLTLLQSTDSSPDEPQPSTSKQSPKLFKVPDPPKLRSPTSPTPPIPDTKALIEASKNLTQTLKRLSKEVLTSKIEVGGADDTRAKVVGPGAVIESMKHHGKGIYSGTFSGTLNPALQDRNGQPKRDISTIIHILNDLLCATPPIAAGQREQKRITSPTPAGHKGECHCGGCSQPSCAYGQCDGHLPAASASAAKPLCTCHKSQKSAGQCKSRLSIDPDCCAHCSGDGRACKKCDTAKALAIDNSKTKCKLEQLRMVMQQKKERREARKLKATPYGSKPPKVLGPQDKSPVPEEINTVA